MRDTMHCPGVNTHDDNTQSFTYAESGLLSVMPAATVYSQNFSASPVQDVALMAKEPYSDGLNSQSAVHAQYVLQLLQLQRKAGFLCDITIQVKDRSFKAHKPLLAACSLYFRSLFADPNSKESTALNLVPLTPAGFEILLDYIYSGHLAITPDNCSAVLSAAICLQMTNVVETCRKFMQSSFQMSACKEPPLSDFSDQASAIRNAVHDVTLKQSSKNVKNVLHSFQDDEDKTSTFNLLNVSSTSTRNVTHISGTGNHYDAEDISDSKDSKAALLRRQSVDSETKPYLLSSNLPSASELQSVLPILMTSYPRQPTPKEVQNILTSFPNAAELLSHYPTLYSGKYQFAADSHQKFQDNSDESTSTPVTSPPSPTPMHLAVTCSSLPMQNGLGSLPSAMLHSDVSSGKDMSTNCSAASMIKTTEQGHVPGEMHHWKHKVSWNSTKDEPNSIEISSDDDENNEIGVKAPVSKTLSLPSLSENTIVVPLTRARSAENEYVNKNASPIAMGDQRSILGASLGRKMVFGEHCQVEAEEDRAAEHSRRFSEQTSDILSPSNDQFVESGSSHASIDEPVHENNFILDLSVAQNVASTLKSPGQEMRHIALTRRSESEMGLMNSSRRSSATSSFSDPGMQLAADALSMLKQSKSKESGFLSDYQANSASGDSSSNEPQDNPREMTVWDEEMNSGQPNPGVTLSKQTTFSRKPRRTTGGQTCSWPGCKRLFRHRNIYEEHQRMHERGIPASQLRKCYMGARVKKTVREQLEEMRTSDSVFEGVNETEGKKYNRARKKKSSSDSQEPLRKRVNVKDRVATIQFANSSAASIPAKEALSNSMRPPTLIPAYSNAKVFPVVGPDGIVKLAQCSDSSPISVASQPPGLTIGNSAYAAAATSLAGGLSGLNRVAISSAHMQRLNPVAATLALLGIQTPMRPNDVAATSPIDQYRQIVTTDAAAQSPPEIRVQPTVAINSITESSLEALSRGLPYDEMVTRGAALLTRSLSSSTGSPHPNKTHPN